MSEVLGIQQSSQWYKVNVSELPSVYARRLIEHRWKNELALAIPEVYPQFEWNLWEFAKCPRYFWDDPLNHRKYFDWMAEKLQLNSWEDWYNVKGIDLRFNNSAIGTVMVLYNNCLRRALKAIYPEHPWEPWRFYITHYDLWSPEELKSFMDSVGNSLGIRDPEGWYNVTPGSLRGKRVDGLLKHFGGSLIKALTHIYPDYEWQVWRFKYLPGEWWKDEDIQKKYMEWLSNELNLKNPSDWFRVTTRDIKERKGQGWLVKQGGLNKILAKCFPGFSFENNPHSSKSQGFLQKIFQDAFPNTEMIVDYKHPTLRYKGTQLPMQLDVFVPSLSLAMEYQGYQHYIDTFYGDVAELRQRDDEKKMGCAAVGITLIEIPFWWDKTKESLLATIHVFRPDVVPEKGAGTPIPTTIPPKYAKSLEAFAKSVKKYAEKIAKKNESVQSSNKH